MWRSGQLVVSGSTAAMSAVAGLLHLALSHVIPPSLLLLVLLCVSAAAVAAGVPAAPQLSVVVTPQHVAISGGSQSHADTPTHRLLHS